MEPQPDPVLLDMTAPQPDLQMTFMTVGYFIDAYKSMSAENLCSLNSTDFRYRVLPKSLGVEEMDNDGFYAHADLIFGSLKSFRMEPSSLIFDIDGRHVVVKAIMHGAVKGKNEPFWTTECILFIRVSEDGMRIEEVEEFVDTDHAREMYRRYGI